MPKSSQWIVPIEIEVQCLANRLRQWLNGEVKNRKTEVILESLSLTLTANGKYYLCFSILFMLSLNKSYKNRKVSLTIHCKYKYFDSTVKRAEDRGQKFYFCRQLPFTVTDVKLNLSIISDNTERGSLKLTRCSCQKKKAQETENSSAKERWNTKQNLHRFELKCSQFLL